MYKIEGEGESERLTTVHVSGMSTFYTCDDVDIAVAGGKRFVGFTTTDGRKIIVNVDAILWIEKGVSPNQGGVSEVVSATLNQLSRMRKGDE